MSIHRVKMFSPIAILAIGFLSLPGLAHAHDDLTSGDSYSNEPQMDIRDTNQDQSQDQFNATLDKGSEHSLFNIESITPEIIINLGKAIWPIIVAGRPVADIRTDWASAVPEGVKSWENLEGWKAPISKPYTFTWKNLGLRMIQFDYTVVFTPGGSINGKGHYLANISVVPAQVHIFWGYKFSAQAQVSNIVNVGTSADPVSATQLVLTWTIDTPLKHHQLSSDFYMTGAGDFRQVAVKP